MCKFQLGDKVLVRDFRPASTIKWRPATITAVCGALIYEVDCEGHQQQLHINHLLPVTRTTTTGPQKIIVSNIPTEARDCAEPLDSFGAPGPTDNDQSTPKLPNPLMLQPDHIPVPSPTPPCTLLQVRKPKRLIDFFDQELIFIYL